jgi:hypothetical protein
LANVIFAEEGPKQGDPFSEGPQQGDPLCVLEFCLTIHPLQSNLGSELRIGYLDGVTLAGHIRAVAADVDLVDVIGREMGLRLNATKLEVTAKDYYHTRTIRTFAGLQQLRK